MSVATLVNLTTLIGRNITSAREASGLSKGKTSRSLGVDRRTLMRWETGVHRPTDANLMAMADLFGHDVSWFFADHTFEA